MWGIELGRHGVPTGKKIPLDASAPVYMSCETQPVGGELQVVRSKLSFVSHFSTCPKAQQAHDDAAAKRSRTP